jgi:hypothetical protein
MVSQEFSYHQKYKDRGPAMKDNVHQVKTERIQAENMIIERINYIYHWPVVVRGMSLLEVPDIRREYGWYVPYITD